MQGYCPHCKSSEAEFVKKENELACLILFCACLIGICLAGQSMSIMGTDNSQFECQKCHTIVQDITPPEETSESPNEKMAEMKV